MAASIESEPSSPSRRSSSAGGSSRPSRANLEAAVQEVEGQLAELTRYIDVLQRPRVRRCLDSTALTTTRRAHRSLSALVEELRLRLAVACTQHKVMTQKATETAKRQEALQSQREVNARLAAARQARSIAALTKREENLTATRDALVRVKGLLTRATSAAVKLEIEPKTKEIVRLGKNAVGRYVAEVEGAARLASLAASVDDTTSSQADDAAVIEKLEKEATEAEKRLEAARKLSASMVDDLDTLAAAQGELRRSIREARDSLLGMADDGRDELERDFAEKSAAGTAEVAALEAKLLAHQRSIRQQDEHRRQQYEAHPLHAQVVSLRSGRLRPLVEGELDELRHRIGADAGESGSQRRRRVAAALPASALPSVLASIEGATARRNVHRFSSLPSAADVVGMRGTHRAASSTSYRVLLALDEETGEVIAAPLDGEQHRQPIGQVSVKPSREDEAPQFSVALHSGDGSAHHVSLSCSSSAAHLPSVDA